MMNRLDLGEVGLLVALTPSDDANTLAVQHMKTTLGEGHVAQVDCENARAGNESDKRPGGHLRGLGFGLAHTYEDLASSANKGRARLTAITKEFIWTDFKSHHKDRAIPLLVLDVHGSPRVVVSLDDEVQPGEQVLSLVMDEVSEREAAQ
jgi:hypothetical protein